MNVAMAKAAIAHANALVLVLLRTSLVVAKQRRGYYLPLLYFNLRETHSETIKHL